MRSDSTDRRRITGLDPIERQKVFSRGRRNGTAALLVFFLAASVILHLVLIEGSYFLANTMRNRPRTQIAATMKVKPVVETPLKKEPVPLPEVPPEPERKVTKPPERPQPAKASPPPELGLEAIGKEHMVLLKEGAFPPLILDYPDPSAYVREMYELGAKTIILDSAHQEYHSIDLFTGEVIPMAPKDFEGFSPFKRVIKDPVWDPQKHRASSRLGSSPENMEILLLLPLRMEERWTGLQVSVFRELGIELDDIVAVEAGFRKSRFNVSRILLKDGSMKEVRTN